MVSQSTANQAFCRKTFRSMRGLYLIRWWRENWACRTWIRLDSPRSMLHNSPITIRRRREQGHTSSNNQLCIRTSSTVQVRTVKLSFSLWGENRSGRRPALNLLSHSCCQPSKTTSSRMDQAGEKLNKRLACRPQEETSVNCRPVSAKQTPMLPRSKTKSRRN